MNQGAKRHALSARGHDLYETPLEAIQTLMRVERLPKVLWEPCAGRGAISEPLRAAGHYVWADDLVAYDGAAETIFPGRDFFRATMTPDRDCSCIVTNPPYKDADRFVRHALTLVPKVIVLLRLMALEGAKRSDLIDWHLRRVWVGRERLAMMHREGWTGKRITGGGFPFAWFVFEATPRQVLKPVELRRMSWREAPALQAAE